MAMFTTDTDFTMDNNANFQTVSKKNKKEKYKNSGYRKPKFVVPAKGTVVDTYTNRKNVFKNDIERLAYCTEHNVPFKIFLNADFKDTVRRMLGLRANRELNRTECVGRQKVTNDTALASIITYARSKPNLSISYKLFCAHAVTKTKNVDLLRMIVNNIMTTHKMTMEQILEARYGDDEYTLLNTAAWNLCKNSIIYCRSNGANIHFSNKNNEDIFTVMKAGYEHQRKQKDDALNKRAFKSYYDDCVQYIRESIETEKRDIEEEAPQDVFQFKSKKEEKKEKKQEEKQEEKKETKTSINPFSAIEDDDDEEDVKTDILYVLDNDGKEHVCELLSEAFDQFMNDATKEEIESSLRNKTNDMSSELINHMFVEFEKMGF
jgi:hypothetical protein